ncbi:MAG TPA: aminodeoxychorismate/anthranilate synthase component II [Bacteroidia bacterium]|jgi:anthranilate synthase component 2|nr:aminodeoxychorismate/anthranilate synthase component II [Bacteroidia bacterium]
MKILVFDNYDSFTYNLVHLVEKITGEKPDVFRNDQIALEEIEKYDKVILSPGPGIPQEAGLLLDVIRTYAGKKDILGVCLGHQAIAEAMGAKLINLEKVFHGVATEVKAEIDAGYLFEGIPASFKAGRYHSWVVDEKTLPAEIRITARDENGQIMALQHASLRLAGVQFHPESIMTEYGEELMKNFIETK